MGRGDGAAAASNADAQANKPKRVRTGCLTCRERHLKCDEGLPNCQNCRKSSRVCKRGIKLNFIDINVKQPPVMPRSREWHVKFEDNSREIASEYKDGLARYGLPDTPRPLTSDLTMAYDFAPTTSSAPRALPPIHIQSSNHHNQYQEEPHQSSYIPRRGSYHHHNSSMSDSGYGGSQLPTTSASSYANTEPPLTPAKEMKYLSTPDEVLYMQIFVEEVGVWMDSMDPQKHFSRILPFKALHEPMLLNAFLACGARHLSLVNSKYSEDRALHYYQTATTYLCNAMQAPNWDKETCATTATILNVYEIMCERAIKRMNHIAGARALIKENGWNARSSGIGAACFWLNVGMELLSCLHFNWQVGGDPDDWGVDMNFSRGDASEELWTHRIMYIVGKIAKFRAAASFIKGADGAGSPRSEKLKVQHRYAEWARWKDAADRWNESVPRTMHPLGYLEPHQAQAGSTSCFPEIYLIKRTAIIARLFYHTAMLLLAQLNPLGDAVAEEMRKMQSHHATMICGIVAHTKDRGIASVALRSLAIAAECLTVRAEQEEVLDIFDRIRKHTGWRVEFVKTELPQRWGWAEVPTPTTGTSSASSNPYNQSHVDMHSSQAAYPQAMPQQQQQQSHHRVGSVGGIHSANSLALQQQQQHQQNSDAMATQPYHQQQSRRSSSSSHVHPQSHQRQQQHNIYSTSGGPPNVSVPHSHHSHSHRQQQHPHSHQSMSQQQPQQSLITPPNSHTIPHQPPPPHHRPQQQQQQIHSHQSTPQQRRATIPPSGMLTPLSMGVSTAATDWASGAGAAGGAGQYGSYYVPTGVGVGGAAAVSMAGGLGVGGGLGFGF